MCELPEEKRQRVDGALSDHRKSGGRTLVIDQWGEFASADNGERKVEFLPDTLAVALPYAEILGRQQRPHYSALD
jgi:hypothetical protein